MKRERVVKARKELEDLIKLMNQKIFEKKIKFVIEKENNLLLSGHFLAFVDNLNQTKARYDFHMDPKLFSNLLTI